MKTDKSGLYHFKGKYHVIVVDDEIHDDYSFTVSEIEEVLFDADMDILRAYHLEESNEYVIALDYELNGFPYKMIITCRSYQDMVELGSHFLDAFEFKRSVLDEL